MKNILLCCFLLFLFSTPARAFEDYIIIDDGKLTDISIENHDVIDVYPLVTIMNEKNTLFVHPLKTGKSGFCVLKDGKERVMFNVVVREDITKIDDVDDFDIIALDEPPADLWSDLDEPPVFDAKDNKPVLRD